MPATKATATPATKAASTAATAAAPAPAKRAKSASKAAQPAAARQPAAAPAAKVAAAAPADAARLPRPKEKLVRDSFTMPRSDFALIQQLKDRAMTFSHAPKKSELLRAGLHALAALPDARLQAVLQDLPALKSGRPRKAG